MEIFKVTRYEKDKDGNITGKYVMFSGNYKKATEWLFKFKKILFFQHYTDISVFEDTDDELVYETSSGSFEYKVEKVEDK